MDAYGVEATSETQKWRRKDPEIDPKEKEQCMNGKGDRLMKRPPGHLARIDILSLVIYIAFRRAFAGFPAGGDA
eukprot:jgi/Picsp_1/4480/NSC_06701-R1_---NA---